MYEIMHLIMPEKHFCFAKVGEVMVHMPDGPRPFTWDGGGASLFEGSLQWQSESDWKCPSDCFVVFGEYPWFLKTPNHKWDYY